MDYFNTNSPAPAVVTAKVAAGAPVTTSGVKIGAPMDLTGLYTVPVKITNTTRSKVRPGRLMHSKESDDPETQNQMVKSGHPVALMALGVAQQ